MSEKVVLTHKEIDGVRAAIELCNGDRGRVLRHHGMPNQTWQNSCAPLREMSFGKLARVLFIGYEVEQPKFKTGDKVTWDGLNEVLVVKSVYQGGGTWCCSFEDAAGCATAKSFRYATPEEIYWLHELGRDKVPDFREGDVVATYEDDDLDIVVNVDCYMNGKVGIRNAEDWFEAGIIKGIYPAESFKPFKKEQTK